MSLSKRRNIQQGGFTLIEVLISTLVLTVGLLGIAAMQMVSFQTNQSAYMRSQATYLAQDMLDRIRANRAGYRNTTIYDSIDTTNTVAVPASPGCKGGDVGCSPTQMGAEDIREWVQFFENIEAVDNYRPVLLNGSGLVQRGAGNTFTITVSWDDRDYDLEGNLTRETISRSVTYTVDLF
ncbi:MAG: type IV pilus modification protein PilV [Halieaceae bacterium]|nr:type IV pilus modification protein PilV [Halieaceae bacterium]